MSDDIVAELDRWLADGRFLVRQEDIIRRARAEIVALRYAGMDDADANEALRAARAEQRERDARIAEMGPAGRHAIAAAIRNQGDER